MPYSVRQTGIRCGRYWRIIQIVLRPAAGDLSKRKLFKYYNKLTSTNGQAKLNNTVYISEYPWSMKQYFDFVGGDLWSFSILLLC